MKQSDVLELVEPGTLIRPGPIGRIVRLALGILCLYALFEIVRYWSWTAANPIATLPNRALLLIAPICIFNYVVNIGFSKSWGAYPLISSIAVLAIAAVVSLLLSGGFEHVLFGITLNLWFAYFYAHLGLSFVLAAIIATPGCEMRSIPELFGRIKGLPVQEHHCPAAFITKIDAWERSKNATS